MNEDSKERFKNDIERAERNVLVVSWCGVISALAIMGYSFWGLT